MKDMTKGDNALEKEQLKISEIEEMEGHDAIPTLRSSHKRALDFFKRNEFSEVAYGLPKKIEQNALDSLRELEDRSVRCKVNFLGSPKQGTLRRTHKRSDTVIRNFSEVESLQELEAMGGVSKDYLGYGYHPINKRRRNQPKKGIQKPVRRLRNQSVHTASLQLHCLKNVNKYASQNLRAVDSDASKTKTQKHGEMNTLPRKAPVPCDDTISKQSSDVFAATKKTCDDGKTYATRMLGRMLVKTNVPCSKDDLPDITSLSDAADVLAMFEYQT